MSQFNAPMRRAGGDLNVYTVLAAVAAVVLLAGAVLLALKNVQHSGDGNQSGGVLTLVPKR